MRSTQACAERIQSFEERTKKFFQKFIHNSSGNSKSSMPYLHYLRNHVGKLMKQFYSLFGWGYGYFSTSAGEHLNKRIKCSEVEETNLDDNRFRNIIHSILSKQLYPKK